MNRLSIKPILFPHPSTSNPLINLLSLNDVMIKYKIWKQQILNLQMK